MYGTASKSKHDLGAGLGATPSDYKSEDFLARMQAIGGVDAAFDAMRDILPNGRSTTFYSIDDLRKKQPGWFRQDLSTLFDLLAQGKIKPAIARRTRLEEAARTHELIEQAAAKGRIVLMVNGIFSISWGSGLRMPTCAAGDAQSAPAY